MKESPIFINCSETLVWLVEHTAKFSEEPDAGCLRRHASPAIRHSVLAVSLLGTKSVGRSWQ